MQFQDTANLLSAIIILCFSFCIFIITNWFKNADQMPKLLGYSFISAILSSFASLLVKDYELSAVLSQSSELMLLLLILLTLAVRPGKKHYMLFRIIMTLAPAALLLIAVLLLPARHFLSQQTIPLSAFVVVSAAILYLLKNEKAELNLLFWAILPLLASTFTYYYLSFNIMVFVSPLLKLGAYIALLAFFYQVFLKSQLVKSGEVEKKLAVINRSIDYEVKKRMLEIEKVNQKLVDISKIDSMSKVMNKTALLDSIENLINGKPGTVFSLLMLDIDNFKTINDTLGHVVGDKCIKMLSATARNNIRDFDLIGRYGGDEFMIVLPGTGTDQAVMIAERFRERVELTASPHYTVSIGIASYPSDGSDAKTLIEVADEGLYRSKRKGRNAVSHKNFH